MLIAQTANNMRVAIVHYWLLSMRGGERVLEQLCEMYPDADIFTLVADRSALSSTILRHNIYETWIAKVPGARRYYQKLLPLMPFALEQLDLRDYDLVISSESGPAKGIVVAPSATHICYCHSPMRYIWNMYHDYKETAGWITRLAMSLLVLPLRQWDFTTAARVDHFIANSHNTSQRIKKYYRRDSTIIHPPVDISRFTVRHDKEDFYVYVGALVAYKRVDILVEAFNQTGMRLIIAGDGEERDRLRNKSNANIEFMSDVTDTQAADLLQGARAFVFAAEEDFGIVPLEAMACGTPVIAYGRGGATETVLDGVTGILFPEQDPAALIHALHLFSADQDRYSPGVLRRHAEHFRNSSFRSKMQSEIEATVQSLNPSE